MREKTSSVTENCWKLITNCIGITKNTALIKFEYNLCNQILCHFLDLKIMSSSFIQSVSNNNTMQTMSYSHKVNITLKSLLFAVVFYPSAFQEYCNQISYRSGYSY